MELRFAAHLIAWSTLRASVSADCIVVGGGTCPSSLMLPFGGQCNMQIQMDLCEQKRPGFWSPRPMTCDARGKMTAWDVSTSCKKRMCPSDMRVRQNNCVQCEAGKTRAPHHDDWAGGDTVCTAQATSSAKCFATYYKMLFTRCEDKMDPNWGMYPMLRVCIAMIGLPITLTWVLEFYKAMKHRQLPFTQPSWSSNDTTYPQVMKDGALRSWENLRRRSPTGDPALDVLKHCRNRPAPAVAFAAAGLASAPFYVSGTPPGAALLRGLPLWAQLVTTPVLSTWSTLFFVWLYVCMLAFACGGVVALLYKCGVRVCKDFYRDKACCCKKSTLLRGYDLLLWTRNCALPFWKILIAVKVEDNLVAASDRAASGSETSHAGNACGNSPYACAWDNQTVGAASFDFCWDGSVWGSTKVSPPGIFSMCPRFGYGQFCDGLPLCLGLLTLLFGLTLGLPWYDFWLTKVATLPWSLSLVGKVNVYNVSINRQSVLIGACRGMPCGLQCAARAAAVYAACVGVMMSLASTAYSMVFNFHRGEFGIRTVIDVHFMFFEAWAWLQYSRQQWRYGTQGAASLADLFDSRRVAPEGMEMSSVRDMEERLASDQDTAL
jgi:hypothetical protein